MSRFELNNRLKQSQFLKSHDILGFKSKYGYSILAIITLNVIIARIVKRDAQAEILDLL